MKRHVTLTLLALMVFGLGAQAQDTLTVAEGSDMLENAPLSHNFPDAQQHTQMIYPAEMLQELEGQMITSMVFHMMYAGTLYNGSPTTVRLGSTTQTAFAAVNESAFLPTAGMTVVFSDTLHAEGATLTINFSEPYVYSGGNLLIDFDYDGQGPMYGYGGQFLGTGTGQRSSLMRYYYPEYDESDVYGPSMLPMVSFVYEEAGDVCLPPTGFTVADITPHTADISWTPRGEGQTVILGMNGEVLYEGSDTAYALSGLNPETEYTVTLQAICEGGDSSAVLQAVFTTGIACFTPTGFAVDNTTATSIGFHWVDENASAWAISIDGETVEESWGTTSYTASGLQPSRGHTISIRANCGDEGFSQPLDTIVPTLCGTITDMPASFGFEEGILYCWTPTGDNWSVATTTANKSSHSGLHMLQNGSRYDNNQPQSIMMPQIAIPDEAEGLQLSWYAAAQGGNVAYTPVTYEVYVGPADAEYFDETTFDLMLTDTLTVSNAYVKRTIEMAAYAGETVTVAFRHTTGPATTMMSVWSYLLIDDVLMEYDMVPDPVIGRYSYRYGSPEGCVMVGEESRFEAWLESGSDEGLVYSWTSKMAEAGLAEVEASDGVLTAVYSTGGRDTITLEVSNLYGSATRTLMVNIDTFDLATLPFSANFNTTNGAPVQFAKWCNVSLDSSSTSAFRLFTPSYDGIYAVGSYALPDSGQTDVMLVSPAIAVPEQTINMSLLYYVNARSTDETPGTYEVLISTSGRSSYMYFTDTVRRDTVAPGNEYTHRSVPLTGYAGDTVYLAFRNTSRGVQSLSIDAIEIREAFEPVVTITGAPQTANAGDTVVLSAVLTEGVLDSVAYTWTSTMLAAGLADTTMLHDSVMVIVYTDGGTDHVSVTATNAFGTSTATADYIVRNCQPIAALPWEPNLGSSAALLCWDMLDIDGDNRTWMSATDHLYGRYNDNGPDDWAITPAIIIPTDIDSVALTYTVVGNISGNLASHYEVRLATVNSTDTADFDVLLLDESIDSTADRVVPLGQWAGDTVRLAFRHLNTADDNGINLYSIAVRDMNVPVVEIEGPEETIAEIETYYTATLTFGAGSNINYIWSSTMNDAGLASMTTNSEQMSITYDTHGTDTIRVTVDNGYSTATATYTVTVAAAPCHTPTDLVTDTADTASVSFSWTPGRDEAEWEVTVGTTVVIVDEPHHTAEGLAADTTYLVLVRAICSEGDTSMALTGMVSTTAPEPGPGPGPGPEPGDGIEDAEGLTFSLYPNPASDIVTVECIENATVTVSDINGRIVYTSTAATTTHRIDASLLPKGTCFVRVTTTEGSSVGKLIVR